ncbi:MAG: hypothetical protein J1E43_08365 [Christensenellaceae bacterium]|nr:hypothetical protein [Christensenellaceae bacterium]
MRTSAPIHVTVHVPNTEEGKRELERRVAAVHADMVSHRLQKLNCPGEQKAALLNALIASVKEQDRRRREPQA